jgi:S-adenosylhomocysteine hydrolase
MNNNYLLPLPLLTYLKQKYNLVEKQCFKNYVCIFIQHLLGSNLSLIKTLEAGGLKKENLYVIGKAYSSNSEVLRYLKANGYNYRNPLDMYSLDVPYDEILKEEIRSVLSDIIKSTTLKVLLIDDAAKGICIIHEEPYIKYISRFKCIELTTRGIRALKRIDLKCPVVDIASSYTKRNIESILIGESMGMEFLRFLELWKPVFQPVNNQVLLIGYGAIGEKVCKVLKGRFNITVFDENSDRCIQAHKDGLKTIEDMSALHYGIIIGCTGNSICLEKLLNHSEILFVNMSSSDLEFGLWRFKGEKKIASKVYNYPVQELPLHEFYLVEDGDKRYYVANGGFPIDFTGGIDPIAPEKIQITRALVLAASIQVLFESDNGILELDHNIQKELNSFFYKSTRYE